MSTRCCVKVIKEFDSGIKEVMLYHHHDGYPEGVGYDLKNRAEHWAKTHPGNSWNIDDIVNTLIKDAEDEYEYTAYNHIDIEYLYTIDCNKMTIKCNKCYWIFEKGINEIGEEVKI